VTHNTHFFLPKSVFLILNSRLVSPVRVQPVLTVIFCTAFTGFSFRTLARDPFRSEILATSAHTLS
jgi:hypothetical protein